MFGELTVVKCLVRKSLVNGCQPKNYCMAMEHCFVFMRYDKIINLCVLSCFYAVGVSNDELSATVSGKLLIAYSLTCGYHTSGFGPFC